MPRWVVRDRYGNYQGDITEDFNPCCTAFILGLPFLYLLYYVIQAIYGAILQGLLFLISQLNAVYPTYVKASPYREVDWFYKSMLISPLWRTAQASVWLVQSILNSFVFLWQYLTRPGLTDYPNLNFIIGISAVFTIILVSLYLLNAILSFFVKNNLHVFMSRHARGFLRLISIIVLAPAIFLVVWTVLGAIFAWLFQKAPRR